MADRETASGWLRGVEKASGPLYGTSTAVILVTAAILVLISDTYEFSSLFVTIGFAVIIIGGALAGLVFNKKDPPDLTDTGSSDPIFAFSRGSAPRINITADVVVAIGRGLVVLHFEEQVGRTGYRDSPHLKADLDHPPLGLFEPVFFRCGDDRDDVTYRQEETNPGPAPRRVDGCAGDRRRQAARLGRNPRWTWVPTLGATRRRLTLPLRPTSDQVGGHDGSHPFGHCDSPSVGMANYPGGCDPKPSPT